MFRPDQPDPALRPTIRPTPPRFAQVGRPPDIGGEAWSRPLILVIAVGVFASFVSLVYNIQTRERLTIVEISFMEEEAAEAERAIEAGEVPTGAEWQPEEPAATPD